MFHRDKINQAVVFVREWWSY